MDRSMIDVFVRHGPRLLVIREEGAALPARGTVDVRSDSLWLSIVREDAQRWAVNLEAFALEVERPEDNRGVLVPLGLDMELEAGGMFGSLLVGDEVIALDELARWTVQP
jgi:hypothetical protein